MGKWKKLTTFCLVGSLVLIFSASSSAAEKKPYKIGGVFSSTGTASPIGNPQRQSFDLLLERINAAGGINGHPLKAIVYDDEGDTTKARLLVTKLMKTDEVLVVVGPGLTATAMASVDLAPKYECPLISCGSAWGIVTDPKTMKERYWVFKTSGNDKQCVENFYEFFKKKGINKIAIFSENTAYGSSGREALIDLANKYKYDIVADEKCGIKDVDMTSQLTRIKASNAQAIIGMTIGQTAVTVVRNWHDMGMTNIPFFQSFGFGNRENIRLAGGAAEGIYTQVNISVIARLLPNDHPCKKVTMEYNLAWEKKFGVPIVSPGCNAWDGLMLAKEALAAVGEKHTSLKELRKAIRDYVENIRGFVGQYGVQSFSPTTHMGVTRDAYVIVVVKNGDWSIVPY